MLREQQFSIKSSFNSKRSDLTQRFMSSFFALNSLTQGSSTFLTGEVAVAHWLAQSSSNESGVRFHRDAVTQQDSEPIMWSKAPTGLYRVICSEYLFNILKLRSEQTLHHGLIYSDYGFMGMKSRLRF